MSCSFLVDGHERASILAVGWIQGADISEIKRLKAPFATNRLTVHAAMHEGMLSQARPVAREFAGDGVRVKLPHELFEIGLG